MAREFDNAAPAASIERRDDLFQQLSLRDLPRQPRGLTAVRARNAVRSQRFGHFGTQRACRYAAAQRNFTVNFEDRGIGVHVVVSVNVGGG